MYTFHVESCLLRPTTLLLPSVWTVASYFSTYKPRSATIQASRYIGRGKVHGSTLGLLVHGVSMPPLDGGRDLEMEENLEGGRIFTGLGKEREPAS
jgi:hypothetical protein